MNITQQLNLYPIMTFYRIMPRTILEKLISRKSDDKVSWKCKKVYMWYVMQFRTILSIIKHKKICRDTLISVYLVGKSGTSLKLTLFTNSCKLFKIQNKAYFYVVLVCFYRVSWKLKNFQICSFNRRQKHHYIAPIPASYNTPIFL